MASDIFPQLPSKDLSHILIRIFQHLNDEKDIHAYRLVSKGWRRFIDNEILSHPRLRKKFHQHPLGLPVEQRQPLIKANPCQDLVGGMYLEWHHKHAVYDSGQYVMITTITNRIVANTVYENHLRKGTLLIFKKTNVALQAVGSVELAKGDFREPFLYPANKNVLAACEDYLFYLTLVCEFASFELQVFKREGDNWNSFQHPAGCLWKKDGAEILGMRRISDNKVLLLVVFRTVGLFKVFNLPHGRVELSGDYVFTQDLTIKHVTSRKDYSSPIFDMDAFGLVIVTDSGYLQHFSFEEEKRTWQMKLPSENSVIAKTRKVTFLSDEREREITILDNANGAITNGFNYKRLPRQYFTTITQSGKYIIFGGDSSQNSMLAQREDLEATRGLVVFDVQESKLLCIPVKLPGITFHKHDYFHIHSVTELSDTSMVYATNFYLRHPHGQQQLIIILCLTHPARPTVLSYNHEKENIVATLPCGHGFFVVGYQWNQTLPSSSFQLFSLKY